MSRAEHGKAVADGQVRYLSPSSITTADHSQDGGCLRKWWFRYVEGRKEPSSPAQAKGTALHAEIEDYLKTGVKALSATVMAGFRVIPEPGPGIDIEYPIAGELEVEGVPLIGYMDAVSYRDTYIDPNGDHKPMAPNSIEIIDWKTTSDLSRAKYGKALTDTPQMNAYGQWAAQRWGVDGVRLSHVYFRTRGRPDAVKSTTFVPVDRLRGRWEQTEAVARAVKDAARITDAAAVDANRNACSAYGGCPHRSYCLTPNRTLTEIFGGTTAMSLLSKIKNVAAPTPDHSALAAEVARLEAEETAARGKIAPAISTDFVDAVAYIESNRPGPTGFPTLGGDAATAFAALKRLEYQGHGLAGRGQLAELTLTTCDEVVQLAGELGLDDDAVAASMAPPAPVSALLPPDAPASDPALAAMPVEGFAPPQAGQTPPTPAPSAVPAGAAAAFAKRAAEPEAPKAKRGRPRKSDATTTVVNNSIVTVTTSVPVEVAPPARADLSVFIDAIASTPTTSLDAYVDGLCTALCTQFGAADIRCAPGDGPLSFGKWKGALAAAVREAPPAPGAYTLDTRGREIAEVVAEALRSVATLYVRGIR